MILPGEKTRMKLLLKVLGTAQCDASQFSHLQKHFYCIETSLVEGNYFHLPSHVFIHMGVMLISKLGFYKHWNFKLAEKFP